MNGTLQVPSAQGIILDDDESFVTVIATNAIVTEGNAGSTPAVFTVYRFGSLDGTANVSFATAGSTPGTDYTPVTGMLTFAPGEASKEITVNVLGDAELEQNDVINLTLSAP